LNKNEQARQVKSAEIVEPIFKFHDGRNSMDVLV